MRSIDGKFVAFFGILHIGTKVVYTFCCRLFSVAKTIELRNTYWKLELPDNAFPSRSFGMRRTGVKV